MSTDIRSIDTDTLLFFAGHQGALPFYTAFESKLYKLYPDTKKRVQKTQITFYNRHVFVCISFLRIKRKAELPHPYLVVTLGLSYPLESDRVAVKTEVYPGRWTTHIVVGSVEEIDEELFDWVGQAYSFSEMK